MKTLFLLTGLTLTLACNNSSGDSVEKADSANTAKRDTNSTTDGKAAIAADKETSEFLVKATDGGIMETELGAIAKVKGQNARVKAFGKMMITDHSAANDQLKQLAAVRNVEIPSRVSNEKAEMIGKINKKELIDFDKAYIDLMVDDHKEDIKEFEEAADKITDTEVKQFINNTLPVLRRHLDSCTLIQQGLKNK